MDTIALQNDRLLVQALPEQGALALTDKQTGVTFRQANSGMQFLRLPARAKAVLAVLCAAAVPLCAGVDSKLACAACCAAVFTLLAWAARWLDRPWPRALCAKAAKLSYAVFLVHHVLIQRQVEGFDLAALSRRDTAFLFLIYLAAAWAAAEGLLWLHRLLQNGLAALRPVKG